LAFRGTQGFTGTVALTCADTTESSNCTDSPASLSLNGETAVNATVTVTTTARSMVAPRNWLRPPRVGTPLLHVSPLLGCLWLVLGLALAGVARRVHRGAVSLPAHPRMAPLGV